MNIGVYSFEDTLTLLGVQVKDLTLDDLYEIYAKYNLSIVVNILEKQIEIAQEE